MLINNINPFPLPTASALAIPEHWWKLNGDVIDYGSASTLYNGSAVSISYTSGLGGDQAASFNGSTSIININNFASIIDISVPGSFMLWVKTASIVGSDGFIYFANASNHRFFCDTVADSDYKLQLGMGTVTPFPASGLAFNSWKHLAFTWNGSNILTYVGGVLSSTDAYSYSGVPPTSFALGNITPISGTRGFNGLEQDVRSYNVQKTITEINTIMNVLAP